MSMISAAIAAPARGGRVIYNVDTQGCIRDGAAPEHITVYIAALEPLPADTLRQRQRTQVLSWLAEHDDNSLTPPELQTTDLGKPYWPDGRWQLNWSHSQYIVALAIAPHEFFQQQTASNTKSESETLAGALGIDLEVLGRSRSREALINRYYHPNEHSLADTDLGFLSIWTRKEAVVKAQGMGLRIDLRSLNTATAVIEHVQLGQWHSLTVSLNEPNAAPTEIGVLSLSWPAALAL
jgi:4'-phosphopantetheinyl transferase